MKVFLQLLIIFSLFQKIAAASQYPDIRQTVSKNTPGGGRQYCGPAALTNIITLVQPHVDSIKTMQKLGSASYMNTSLKTGTGVRGVVKGLEKYFEEQKISFQLEYQGWRRFKSTINSGVTPTLKWLRQIQNQNTTAMVNIGWYKKESLGLRRVGGHWVTAFDSPSLATLVISDPSSRSGKKSRNENIKLTPLKQGRLVGNKKGLPRKARGLFQITGELRIKKGVDKALIDGVLLVKILDKNI